MEGESSSNREDTDFVELVKEDLDLFIGGRKNIPRVLLFPPVNSYLRLLIHKTAEEYDKLSSFSVGEGEARQTVVCFSSQLAYRERTEEAMSGHRPPAMRGRGRAKYRDQNSPSPTPGHIQNKGYGDGRASPDTWYGDKQSQLQRPGDEGERLTPGCASPAAPGVDSAAVKDRQRKADRTRNRRPDVQVYVPRARRSHAGRGYDPGTEVQSPQTPGGVKMDAHRKVKQERELYVPKPRLPQLQHQQTPQPVPSESRPISRGEAEHKPPEESGDWTETSQQIPETHLSKRIKVQDKRELRDEVDLNTGDRLSVDNSIPSHTSVSNNYTEEVDRENVNTSKQKYNKSNSVNENETVKTDFDITEPTSDIRTFSDSNTLDCNTEMKMEESEKDSRLFDTCDKNFRAIETTIAEAIPKQENFGTITGISKTDEMSQSGKISEDNVSECLEVRTKVVDEVEIKDSAESSIGIVTSQFDSSHEMIKHLDDGIIINSSSKDIDYDMDSEKQDNTLEDTSCDTHVAGDSSPGEIEKMKETLETMVAHRLEQSVDEKQEKVYDSIEDAFIPSDDDAQSDTTYPPAELTSNSKQDVVSNQLFDEDKNIPQSVAEDKNTHHLVAEDKKVYDSIEDAFMPSDDDDAHGDDERSNTNYLPTELSAVDVKSKLMQDSSSNQLFDEDKNTHQLVAEDKNTLPSEDKNTLQSVAEDKNTHQLVAEDKNTLPSEDKNTLQSVAEDKNTKQSVAEDKNTLQSVAEDKNIHQSVAEDKHSIQSEQEEPDEDSWDALYNEDGDCLDPDAMDELTKNVGKVTIEKSKKINYLDYQPKDKGNFDYTQYAHIIEIYDFPKEFVTRDLIMAFQSFMSRGFDLKWVDDTHALGIFSSKVAVRLCMADMNVCSLGGIDPQNRTAWRSANDALDMIHPLVKVCSLAQASRQSREKARKCTEFLQPYKPRPETSAMAARRLVAGALGIATNVSREKRELERKQLKEAKEKRRKDRRNREDIWEFGRCAMDEET